MYSNELLPNKEISLAVKDELVSQVLQKLLLNTGFKYKVINEELIVIAPEGDEIKDVKIKGHITDESGKPLAGVSIVVSGTKAGTSTNESGDFEINVPSKATVTVSYIGYFSQTVETEGKARIDLSLKINPTASLLNEIVVIGYGTQKRKDITGSVTSVPQNRLSEIPVTNILHAIEGSVAGVNITQTSSVPGSSASILVRGQNSLNASTSPLIIVDGLPFSTADGVTNDINPNDIASIEILKDASAVAIYGTQGSNGVILITTKRGSGKPTIKYSVYGGLENLAHTLTPRSPAEYVQKYADYWSQTQTGTQPILGNAYEVANYNAGKTVDWLKEATQQGIVQDHNLSISGGSKDVKYYISGEYMKEKGAVKGYQYHRASFRSNLDINITDYITVGTSLFYANNNYDGGRVNLLNATAMSPYGTEYDASGNYMIYPMYPELLYTNPLIGLYVDRINRTNNLNGNAYAELKFSGVLKGLKYRVNAGYTYIPTRYADYTGRNANATLGTANINNNESNTWVIENIVTYNKDWKKHHIDFTGLYSAQSHKWFYSSIYATGFINDIESYNSVGSATTQTVTSNANKFTLNSQMARINYSYNSKYLITLTARRDGYSAFGSYTDKYKTFPSAAFAWNVSNEAFMQHITWVNNLKLRTSYGTTGNSAISANQTSTTESSTSYVFNSARITGVTASSMGNKNLHWESTTGLNVGLDFAIIKSRISGTIDAYFTRTKDNLVKRNIPYISGYSYVWDNLGKVHNQGLEITLNTKNIQGRMFRWESAINFTTNRNRLIDIYGDKKSDVGNKWFIGHPIGVIYDYKMVGVWQTGESVTGWDAASKAGYLKFADINKDGKISSDSDRIICGQTSPKWTGGITNTFHYGNWHLNVFIQTIQGITKSNTDLNYADELYRRNSPKEVGYWTVTNKSNDYPSMAYTNTRGYSYPRDASYTRIKDVTLSYTMPQRMLDKSKVLGSATFYLSGRNLYTFTNWIGWDPENNYSTRGSGDWTNNYPESRTIVFGVNLSFR